MTNKQAIGWAFLCLMGTTMMAPPVFTYPQEHRQFQPQNQYDTQSPVYQGNYPVYQPEQDARKFVEKPNASKKVVSSTGVVEDRNDLDDVQTNSISVRHILYIFYKIIFKIVFILYFSKIVAPVDFLGAAYWV